MIHRYSSRRSPLKDFLATRLQGTRRYGRIAGFFSSSLLEVAGEALERMTPEGGKTCVRVEWICDHSTEAFSKNIGNVDIQTPVEISKR
jgi:hypothetical protein